MSKNVSNKSDLRFLGETVGETFYVKNRLTTNMFLFKNGVKVSPLQFARIAYPAAAASTAEGCRPTDQQIR